MITFLIITTSILVGVSVKLHLDKLDLVKELDNVRENHNLKICALDRELDATKRLYITSVETLKEVHKDFSLLGLKYNLYKTEAEKIHEELNQKVAALEIINEGCTNDYFNQVNKIFELSAKVSTLKDQLKKERNKAKQIKYDKKNDTIVDPIFLTDLGEL
jgi:hypothetical protein